MNILNFYLRKIGFLIDFVFSFQKKKKMEHFRQYYLIYTSLAKVQETLFEMFPLYTLSTLYQIIYDRTLIDYQCLIKHSLDLNKQRTYLILLIDRLNTILLEKLHLKIPTGYNFVLDIYNCFEHAQS